MAGDGYHQDVMGFLAVAAPPGDPVMRLRFDRPLENRIGCVVTLGTAVLLLGVSIRAIATRRGITMLITSRFQTRDSKSNTGICH
jgi:hypothetical protein